MQKLLIVNWAIWKLCALSEHEVMNGFHIWCSAFSFHIIYCLFNLCRHPHLWFCTSGIVQCNFVIHSYLCVTPSGPWLSIGITGKQEVFLNKLFLFTHLFLLQLLHESGISLRSIFLFLSACSVIHLLRTFFLMPKKFIPYPLPEDYTYGYETLWLCLSSKWGFIQWIFQAWLELW